MPQKIDPKLAHLMRNAPRLANALSDLPMQALDIGARRGFTDDLLPLAPAIDAIAFEPDREECERLNQEAATSQSVWRSLRYLPVALGPTNPGAKMNLYRQRGCSSLLEAAPALAAQFSRGDDYVFEGTINVETVPLDEAAKLYDFTGASFLKIDVQGFENSIFETGGTLLAGPILAVRSEVTAIPLYKNMPLIEDVIALLREFGFLPMSFEEIHHWRRSTRIKHPRQSRSAIPYSRGQLVHGDILFFRDPDTLPDDAGILMRAAFYAIAYGHMDHAAALMQRSNAARWLKEHGVPDPLSELGEISRRHARLYRQQCRHKFRENLLFRARQFVGI